MEVIRMIKISKPKLLSVMVFVAFLLISSTYASLMPTVYASAPDDQAKTINVLNTVMGLNTQLFELNQTSQLNNKYISLPQQESIITLVSNQSSVKADCCFVNNTLRMLYLSDYSGVLSLKQQADSTVDMAKDFLARYQSYVKESFYGTLASMLSTIKADANSTQINGNVRLDVSNYDGSLVDYMWTYVDSNGVEAASKNVILSYDGGQLKDFVNNWPLYKVVTDTPKISVEKASEIAIEASKSYSYDLTIDNRTLTVSGFKIAPESLQGQTLSYLNFPDEGSARGGDPFMLYPSWYVQLGFDKFYPGDVTGLTATIWADTGEISSMHEMVCGIQLGKTASIDQETSTQHSSMSSAIIIVTLLTLVLLSVAGKRYLLITKGKLWGTFLCFIIVSCLILAAIPKVDGSLPNSQRSKSMVYGIDSGTGLPTSEAAAAREVCNFIGNKTGDNGYDATNLYGEDTTKVNVLTYTQSSETNFGRVAMFHFGHFAINPYVGAYQDNTGLQNNAILWSDVDDLTTAQKHFFVWIWVCVQAQHANDYMPVAWTHRDSNHGGYMADDGYSSPDNGGHCFMTFEGISPQIGNSSVFNCTAFYNRSPGPLKNFIEAFYNYALSDDYQYSIKDSLDHASNDFFGTSYENSVLNCGYNGAWYPYDPNYPELSGSYYPGKMHVFGNSDIKLYQPKVTLTANHGLSPTFYIDGSAQSTGNVRVIPGSYSMNLGGAPSGYSFHGLASTYMGLQTNLPQYYYLQADGTLTAIYYYTTPTAPSTPDVSGPIPSQTVYAGYEYQFCASSTDPNELETIAYTFDWGDGTNSTVDGYSSGDTAYASHTWSSTGEYYVTAIAQDSYGLYSDTSDPVGVNVEELEPTYNLGFDAYDDTWTQINVGVYIDNNWVGTTPCTTYLHAGTYYVSFDNSFYEWWGDYEYLVSGSGYVYLSSDTGVTAYYAVQGK
jgi:hypothetical protein